MERIGQMGRMGLRISRRDELSRTWRSSTGRRVSSGIRTWQWFGYDTAVARETAHADERLRPDRVGRAELPEAKGAPDREVLLRERPAGDAGEIDGRELVRVALPPRATSLPVRR